jgi:hypoxanthine phosphoribosyltransferase
MISSTQWSEEEKNVIGLVDGSIKPTSGQEAHFVLVYQNPTRLSSAEEKLWLAVVEKERGGTRQERPWIKCQADQFWEVLNTLLFNPTTQRINPYPNIYQQTLEEFIFELQIRKRNQNILELIGCVNQLLSPTKNRNPQEIGELIGSSSIGKELLGGESFAELWRQNDGRIEIPNQAPLKKFFTVKRWNLELSVIYLVDYYPVWQHGYKHKETNLIIDIKNGDPGSVLAIANYLQDKISEGIVLTYVPSSKKENTDTGIRGVVRLLTERGPFSDATNCVVRHTTAPESKGRKEEEKIRETIRIENPDKIQGKNVLILDDVTTSGASMRACTKLLMEAGAYNVRCLAIGLTRPHQPANLKDLIKLDPETKEEIARREKEKLEKVTARREREKKEQLAALERQVEEQQKKQKVSRPIDLVVFSQSSLFVNTPEIETLNLRARIGSDKEQRRRLIKAVADGQKLLFKEEEIREIVTRWPGIKLAVAGRLTKDLLETLLEIHYPDVFWSVTTSDRNKNERDLYQECISHAMNKYELTERTRVVLLCDDTSGSQELAKTLGTFAFLFGENQVFRIAPDSVKTIAKGRSWKPVDLINKGVNE